jgi:hypothetical protein
VRRTKSTPIRIACYLLESLPFSALFNRMPLSQAGP